MFEFWGLLKLLLLFVVCHTGVDCRSPPKILDVDDITNSISIQSSTPLVIKCEGHNPVTWKLKNTTASRATEKAQTVSTHPPVHLTILTIQQAIFTDTGSYTCVYNDVINSPSLNDLAEVYVFVNDPENLLLPLPNHGIVTIRQDTESIIPCLPTSLDVDVGLWKGFPGERLSVNDVDLVFDPTKGFIISFATLFYNGEFYCKGELNGKTKQRNFHAVFIQSPVMVPTPLIELQAKYAVIESSFVIYCSVKSPKDVYVYLNWTYPDTESSRIKIGVDIPMDFEKKFKETKKNLTISSVRQQDQGTYVCTATDHNGRHKSTSLFVEVRSQDYSYIRLKTDFDHNDPFTYDAEFDNHTFIRWVVSVDAFPPNPTIMWYKHQKPLTNSTKYSISNTASLSVFTIHNPETTDSSDYFVNATVGNEKHSLMITLLVFERPNVTLRMDRDIYRFRDHFNIECFVNTCPSANLSWEWSPCKTPGPCAKKYHELTESEQNTEGITEYEELLDGCRVTNILSGRVMQPGYYRCTTVNDKGRDSAEIGLFVTTFPDKFNIKRHNKDPFEQDKLELTCYASTFYYSTIQWLWKPDSSPAFEIITNSSNTIITSLKANYSIISTVEFDPILAKNAGNYTCRALKLSPNSNWDEVATFIRVKRAVAPVITATNMNNSKYTIHKEDNFEFLCRAFGLPAPTIKWYLNGTYIHQPNNTAMHFEDNKAKLIISRVLPTDTGNYVCVVSNSAGSTSRNASLLVLDAPKAAGLSTGALSGIIVVIVVFILATIIFGIFLGRKIYRERKEQQELEQFQHMLFDQGDSRIYDPMLPLEEQVDSLPYDKRWEFPKEKLKLGKVIGQGAFGRVIKAEATGIIAGEEVTTVAVKMLKERADWEQRKALMQELKIMIHLGRHLNVVNVLGAVTQNLHKGEFQVIVEYCRFGNLRHYLLRHRGNFIDQINPETGEIDMAVRHRPHESVFFAAPVRASKQMRSSVSNNSSVCVSPTEDLSMTLTTCADGVEPAENNRVSAATAKAIEARTITTYHLICYAYQICCGMQYLVSKKLVHRDLALRNILLAEGDIVKICDFGLTKDMYHKNYYRKKGKGALPVKWMAIESIGDRVFSPESDVWSFGIVLWELYTLGGNPYPGLEVDEYFYRRLLNGFRMEKPQLSPQSIYDLMLQCWQHEPKGRPSFDDIYAKLSELLEATTVQHYQQLNDDYLKPENVVGNPYYLSMLPSDNDYYNEQEFNQTADNEGYIDRDDKTIGINTAKGIVNYANLPSPIADSNPDQRSALYGDKKPNHQETAPMLSSPNIRPLLTPSSGAPNGEIMTPSTNPFVYPPSNNTNPFLPNFSSPNNGPYLDMGSNSNLLETDITLRGQNKDSDEILASPPPRYTEVFNDKYFN